MIENYLKSDIRTINALLTEGHIRFIVPLFQREFSWEREQIEQIWEDINETILENNKEYFLGTMVFNKKSENEIEIIDGQQRLAVLTIIFAVIRDIYNKMGDERHPELQTDYIAKKDRETRNLYGKLTLNKDNKDFFLKYIQSYEGIDKNSEYKKEKKIIPSNRLIFSTYKFLTGKINEKVNKINSQIDKTRYLVKLENCISQNFKVIVIYVGNESDAYLIFETLNDRGLELSITDLLKNHLFSKAGLDLKDVQRQWDEIITILGNRNVNTFLRHFWISTKSLVREKNLYSVLKKSIKEKGHVLKFVSELKSGAEIYDSLLNPDTQYWKSIRIINLLKELNTLNIKQCFPFLMSCKAKFRNKDFIRLLKMCLNFSFRYSTICNFNPNVLEKLYSRIAIEIRCGKLNSVKSIETEIKKTKPFPDDRTFKLFFEKKEIKEKKVARYILKKINDYMLKSNEIKTADSADVNLEHILPQNPDIEWEKYFRSKSLEYEELVYKIGNMTLLGSEYNRKASNKLFTKKKTEIYKKSKLPITIRLLKVKKWDNETIKERQKLFAKKAVNIWKM